MQQFGKIWVESKQSSYLCCPWVSGNSRSRLFTGMKASGSCSRILEMECFIPFLFPNFGNGFFHSLPVHKLWEQIYFIHLPFPNSVNSFPLTPVAVGMVEKSQNFIDDIHTYMTVLSLSALQSSFVVHEENIVRTNRNYSTSHSFRFVGRLSLLLNRTGLRPNPTACRVPWTPGRHGPQCSTAKTPLNHQH